MKKTMNKNIKDYLHLYLGCECIVKEPGESAFKSVLEGIQRGKFLLKEYGHLLLWEAAEIKPVLRPLSDMTEHESNMGDEIMNAFNENDPIEAFQGMANMTMMLLKQGFDLFGLIESGLALDKTKLTIKTHE